MNNKIKLFLGATVAFIIIISSIMVALSILKDEAVNNFITISKLNAKSFSKEINQDLGNIEQTIINISSILDLDNIEINKRLQGIQENFPQIRSINILKNQKIIYSTNKFNLDLFIDDSNFYPKTIFDDNVLRVSTTWVGRDFISGSNIYNYEEEIRKKELFFIPISKMVSTKNGDFNIIINLNYDYFKNRFLTDISSENIVFELIRLDGVLLFSTHESGVIGRKIKEKYLIEKIFENNHYSNIETIDGVKYILTFTLTKDYPICLAVKMDYEKSLLSWDKKQYNFFIITTLIIIVSMIFALVFFYLFNRQKEKEIKLHRLQIQEHEKFKLLFQNSHFLSALIDDKGEIIEMNHKALDFLGFTNKQVLKINLWDLSCWEKNVKKRLKIIIEKFSENIIDKELIVFDKYKERKFIEFSLFSINSGDKKLLVAIGLDITQRKERENKLTQAYAVFDNTRDGIIITDKNTNITDVNKAFERITGYNKEEVVSQKTNILKSSIHTKQFYESMWEKLSKKGFWEGEIVNINKNGENFNEWLTIDTIYDKNGEVSNYIGVFSDITEQKIKEKLLKEKDDALYQQSKMAAMGEMIGNIAHQWRQPLSIISTAATGILVQKELGVSDEESEKNALNSINKSSQYLSQTIEDFRNFLRVDKKMKLFKLSKAIEESIILSNVEKNEKRIKLQLSLDETYSAYGIKNEFIQVIINLLKNSYDAYSLDGEDKYIFIDIFKEENNIYIKIKDTAGGIKEDIIDRIFEPYFTTKHQSQGTGIGLYMSEEIIKNHMNGQLYVKNEQFLFDNNVFRGACFTIKLPFY